MAIATDVSDLTLLERFVSDREEAAFVALVNRHGPRVQGTCRRLLKNEHDVEEVFQATFLLLARKAPDVAWRESVGSWLCAVAHRLALAARADAARHRRRETPFATLASTSAESRLPERYHPQAAPLFEVENRDLRRVLDDELLQLPEKYRAPVVLCDLEGRSHQEAAEQLGWPSGSMSRRLDQARALLRRRLVHRGVTLTIGLAGLGLAALLAGRFTHSERRDNGVVRAVMTTLRPLAAGVPGVTSRSAAISDDEHAPPDVARIIVLARQAASAATEIESHNPGRNRDTWRGFAFEMHQSGLQLAQATQEHNELAMLSAARRLDASCVKCHEVFGE